MNADNNTSERKEDKVSNGDRKKTSEVKMDVKILSN